VLHGARLDAEALVRGALAEHILAVGTEIMPSGHRKGQMLLHLFAHDDPLGIIILKGKGDLAFGPLIGDPGMLSK